MTVDSTYIPTPNMEPDNSREYPFEIESIGDPAIDVYLILSNGTRVQLEEYVA